VTAAGRLLLVLTGPTAAGKTDLAVALARRLPVSLISADSAMVYRGMDVGTAKPDPATRRRWPHALIDLRDPADPYTVADFRRDADRAAQLAWQRGRLPVLVGGTMLYLRAFRDGLAKLPPADPALRQAIAAEADARGWPALHDELRRVDPQAAAGIHPRNPQRLQRALEVYRQTGIPLSSFWEDEEAGQPAVLRLRCRLHTVALLPKDRSLLHRRIERRFEAMLAAGLLEEVAALRARPELHPGLPALRAVGYRQAWACLEGRCPRDELAARGAAATRQLARRQLTWLRRWPDLQTLPAPGLSDGPDEAAAALGALAQQVIDTGCLAIS